MKQEDVDNCVFEVTFEDVLGLVAIVCLTLAFYFLTP